MSSITKTGWDCNCLWWWRWRKDLKVFKMWVLVLRHNTLVFSRFLFLCSIWTEVKQLRFQVVTQNYIVSVWVLTCSVNVKVCWFVGHVSRLLQSRPAGLNSGRITHGLRNIHHEGTPVDVLPSKQHLHLRGAGTHGPVSASDGSLPSLINVIGGDQVQISCVETLQKYFVDWWLVCFVSEGF